MAHYRCKRHYRDDELVLNYQDACIYGRDLKLLEQQQAWLNDACIHFFLKRLVESYKNNNSNENDNLSNDSDDDALCLDPAVLSFLMHQCDDPDELADFCRGYNHFEGIRRVFLPINDNLAEDSANWHIPGRRGTHWSLLLALEQQQQQQDETEGSSSSLFLLKFFHFDSVPGHNSLAAQAVAQMWHNAWSTAQKQRSSCNNNIPSQATPPPSPLVYVEECPRTPKQANGYDCGLHVLGAVEALLISSSSTTSTSIIDSDDGRKLVDSLTGYFTDDPATACTQLRRRIAQDIRTLASD